MNNIEREMILIVYESKKKDAEIERVIIYKDRETALNALFGEYSGRSILTMAEVNREVTPVVEVVKQDTLFGD